MRKKLLALFALSALLVFGSANAASAASDPLQQQVDQMLAQYPGGTQTGPGEISWQGGEVVLTLEEATASRVAAASSSSCAKGSFCAYTGAGQSGSKLSFTNCTAANSTAPLTTVRSIANGRTSGTVWGFNGSTKTVTVAANSSVNTSAKVTRLGC